MTKIIKDYHAGKVRLGRIKQYLSFLVYKEDRRYRENADKLRNTTSQGNSRSAEDEYFETIAHMEVSDILDGLVSRGVITEEQLSILSRHCIDLESQATIAKDLKVSKQYVAKIIANIKAKCREFIDSTGSANELLGAIAYLAATTVPKSARKDAGSAKHKVRWPSEFLMNVSIDGQWVRNKYKLRNHCILPEYLAECFGDRETKCGLCHDEFGGSTCSRKAVNGQ